MDLGYKEKSVIGTLLISLVVNIYYFSKAWELYQSGAPSVSDLLPLMGVVVVLLIVLEIIYEAVISTRKGGDLIDERDKAIEGRGNKFSAYVLAVGIYFCLGHVVLNDVMGRNDGTTIFITANALILTLVIAEFAKGISQISAYRRGA